MSKSLPYYKMFPSDAEIDENYRAMDDMDLGFYWRCLNQAWSNGGSLPADLSELARGMKQTLNYVKRRWKIVGRCWEPHPEDASRVVNPRQFREWNAARTKSEHNTAAVRSRYERRNDEATNVPPRAYGSDSVSGFEVGGKGAGKGEPDPDAKPAVLEILDELRPIYYRAGAPIPPKHEKLAVDYLLDIPEEKRHRVVDYVKHCLSSGKWRGVSTTKGLLNLLRDGDWDVPIVERDLRAPPKTSRREENISTALTIFKRGKEAGR